MVIDYVLGTLVFVHVCVPIKLHLENKPSHFLKYLIKKNKVPHLIFFTFFFFWPHRALWYLSSLTRVHGSESPSLNHRTAREFPIFFFFLNKVLYLLLALYFHET